MGTLTTNLNFYKPASTEFVDVETQLNRNWDIADRDVRRLLEYEFSNLAVPNNIDAVNRSRFYKIYSNSIQAWLKTSGFFWQDPYTYVSAWVPCREFLTEDFKEHPSLPICYRIIKKAISPNTTQIEWMGAFQTVTEEVMDLEASVTVIAPDVIPVGVRPSITQYATVNAGNTTTNYSMARLIFTNAGELQYHRYGATPSAGPSTENRCELTGVTYNVEVTGT
jgi:hypothetical protein